MTPRELLITGAREIGIDLSIEQENSLFIYLAELKKWNRKINLTAIRDEQDIIIKHVLDSLTYTKGFGPRPGLRLMDMGSGAGFPAVPIKLVWPGIAVTMVESIHKKASFLRHVVRTLALSDVEVVDERTERLSEQFLNAFDVVTARAFASINSAVESARPFLKKGGSLVLSRGPQETVSEDVLTSAGMIIEKKTELTLPHSDYRRIIWVVNKTLD